MKKNSQELLEALSKKVMFNLSEKEIKELLPELNVIIERVATIQAIDVQGYEPMHFPFTTSQHQLREDSVFHTIAFQTTLDNVAKKQAGYISINKVIN